VRDQNPSVREKSEVKGRMSDIEIVEVTKKSKYEKYLYRCLAPIPYRKYNKRHAYLEAAIPRGLRKKILLFKGDIVGQIEYAPAGVSGYPIQGDNIVVMNCIWVLRRAKGHSFGERLMVEMMKSEKGATGFATLALESHWSGWLRKEQLERLGFKSIESLEVRDRVKRKGWRFRIHLMWLPVVKGASPPEWDKSKILQGVDFCIAHPLYHPEKIKEKEIMES